MNSRKLLALSLAALIVIAAGVWIASHRASPGGVESAALYPDLRNSLNDTTGVRIFGTGNELAVELARENDAWTVRQRSDYPADTAKVRELLLGLADAKLREEKTSNPDNYASLGVEDVSEDAATGHRIEVSGAEPAVDLIVGKRGPGSQSRYVRRSGESQSWLIDADLDAPATPQDWLGKSIVDVTADRIQSVTILTEGAKPYTAAKNARSDANFSVEALPKGRQLSSPAAPNSLATALAGLTLVDVRGASEFDAKPEAHASFRAFDGLIVDLQGWTRDEKHYVALSTRFDEALAQRFAIADEDGDGDGDDTESSGSEKDEEGAESDSAEAQASNDSNAGEEAASLNERLDSWVYEIPGYKYEAIFKPLADMLQDG